MAASYNVLIVLPNQLFYDDHGIKVQSKSIISENSIKYDHVYVVEHPSYFVNHAKTQIILLRSCMKNFYSTICINIPTTYVDYKNYNIKRICKEIHKLSPKTTTIYIANPEDFDIFQEFDKIKYNLQVHHSRLFIIPFDDIIQDKHTDINSFSKFYIEKYGLDKLTNKYKSVSIEGEIAKTKLRKITDYHSEAVKYAECTSVHYLLWDNRDDVLCTINECFCCNLLVQPEHILTVLNTGIITPWDIIECINTAPDLCDKFAKMLISFLLEREFYRAQYIKYYKQQLDNTPVEMRNMTDALSNGTTQCAAFNDIIQAIIINSNPLAHHVLRCYRDITLLTQTKIQDVYNWLTRHLTNSYPWYIFGMVQTEFHCDSLIKPPYISLASEVQKMLKFINSPHQMNATDWNNLVMYFIHNHDELMRDDVRTKLWKKKKAKDKKAIIDKAKAFIDSL